MRKLFLMGALSLSFAAGAEPPPNDPCGKIIQEAFTFCDNFVSQYQHGALQYFARELCHLNRIATAHPKTVLCHFTKGMGLNPVKGQSEVITKTFNDPAGGPKTVELTVTSPPTETWATENGYDFKATVKFDGSQFMTLFWGGTGNTENEELDESFGFLIQGPGGPQGPDSMKRIGYFEWSRKTGAEQFVRGLEAQFTTSYLTSASPPGGGMFGGDRATYGKLSFDPTTKSAKVQVVKIENQREVCGGNNGSFGCFKMFAEGTKGGTVKVAKTHDPLCGTGHAVTHAATDENEMDGVQITDSGSTPNGNHTPLSGTGFDFVAFDRSCNALNDMDTSGQPFFNNMVDFNASPSTIFP